MAGSGIYGGFVLEEQWVFFCWYIMGCGIWSGNEGTGSSWHDPSLACIRNSNPYNHSSLMFLPWHPFNSLPISIFIFSVLSVHHFHSVRCSSTYRHRPRCCPTVDFVLSSFVPTGDLLHKLWSGLGFVPRLVYYRTCAFPPATRAEAGSAVVKPQLMGAIGTPQCGSCAKMSRSWFRLWLLSVL